MQEGGREGGSEEEVGGEVENCRYGGGARETMGNKKGRVKPF